MQGESSLEKQDYHQFMQRKIKSSRREKPKTFFPSRQSARTLNTKAMGLKPESVFNKQRPKSKLIPSFRDTKTPGLRKTFSQPKLSTLKTQQQTPQGLPNVVPPMKKELTRRTLAGSSLQRIYSNPQFTKLNQDPYFRPKTSAFGYVGRRNADQELIKQTPWKIEKKKDFIPNGTSVKSITGIKVVTSLGPRDSVNKMDNMETSPAKRSLSRKTKRKKIKKEQKDPQQQTLFSTMYDKRPKTSYLLQSCADRMHWPQNPEGRGKLNPLTPVKAFLFNEDTESKFLHSEKDFKMTMENSQHGHLPDTRIEEVEELSKEEENLEDVSKHSDELREDSQRKRVFKRDKNTTISDVIKLLQNEPKETGQYFYLIKPIESGPYDLQPLLELEDHNKLQYYKKFYTLSSKGITTYLNDEPVEFITLNDWLADRENYTKIRRKTFFQKFDRWKILRTWKDRINERKRETVTEILEDKLFILHPHFSKVLLDLKKRCCEMEGFNFIELTESHEAITKEVFSQKQESRRNLVKENIEGHSKHSREEFREGIKNVLDELKAKMHEGNENDDSIKKKDEGEQRRVDIKTSESDRVYEDLGFKPNLKFGAKSSLRKECSRFLRCAYLLDFITMDALTNIYLNSVKILFDKLQSLSIVDISYEFDATKSQFGESKRAFAHAPEPMFKLEAVFHEDTIHPSNLIERKVKRFTPPPMGNSTSADFDPMVHLELEELKDEEEEEEDFLEETDEESQLLVRFECPKIHEIWIKLDPNKTSFIDLLEESINQGYSNIKSIERWSRHGELLKYVNVLESWDDKVCDSWDPPDDNYLD